MCVRASQARSPLCSSNKLVSSTVVLGVVVVDPLIPPGACLAGDDTKKVGTYFASRCKTVPCFVAVDTSISSKTVVGLVLMHIPASDLDEEVEKAIDELMPDPSKKKKNKVIGYIAYVIVAKDRQGERIGTKLLEETFHEVRIFRNSNY
ncbi:hypothetical protein Pmar_PMAR029688 [Perkinsus marinus ATCC 50983]|uniref:N-acetyltransferase domain-containing protein n=1 Tax=Perkinsus marinus (strain ATCC 50983 / TXsc) TaxID=423536 RepID=C5KQH5_PERM5|nr:hypothetical protein Pmar_PMAR029688 [Perkinsus marinus ATCC 50983]EER13251.1 hypothetical protein Pmar_PMAR029688 [Perkinsus marinus ATCC 50983]|eukprot:XP_002781456.1 hypothetical protein Pmar_PMAR029688 [Perkinsus marinus ATCC 50983]